MSPISASLNGFSGKGSSVPRGKLPHSAQTETKTPAGPKKDLRGLTGSSLQQLWARKRVGVKEAERRLHKSSQQQTTVGEAELAGYRNGRIWFMIWNMAEDLLMG